MTPTPEGVRIFQDAPPPRVGERVAFGSIYGRDVVSHGSMRPRVIVNEGDTTSWYNAGLTAPGKGAYASELISGGILGKALFGIARYDSVRDRYSNHVPIGTYSGDLVDRDIVYNPDTDDAGIPLGLSTGPYPADAKVRTKLRMLNVSLTSQQQFGLIANTKFSSITLKLRAYNGTALTGTLSVSVDGVGSDTVDASTLSDYYGTNPGEYKDVAFNLNTPIEFEGSKTVNIELSWSAASTQTTNLVLWKGNFTTPATPSVGASLTSPTVDQIAEDVLGTMTGSSWSDTISRFWTGVTISNSGRRSDWRPNIWLYGRVEFMIFSEYNGPPRNVADRDITGMPVIPIGSYTTFDGYSWTGPRLSKINGGRGSDTDNKIVGNVGWSSYSTITVDWDAPPGDPSEWVGKNVTIYGASTSETPAMEGRITAADSNSFTMSGWYWNPRRTISDGSVIRRNVPNGVFAVEGLITSTWTSSGTSAAYEITVSDSLDDSVNEFDFTGTSYGGIRVDGIANCRGDEETDEYDSFALLAYLYSTGEWYKVATISKTYTETYDITTVDPQTMPVFPPLQNYVPPSANVLKKFVQGNVERLVLLGQDGFDCFVDMPRLKNLNPSARLDSNGLITFSTPVYAYRDGTYLVTAYDYQGNELLRAFVYASGDTGVDHTGTGIGSVSLTQYQLQVCKDFDRTAVYGFDQDASGNWATQRWEIRRQVVAHATRNSRTVNISYDVANTSAPEVLGQHIVHCPVQVGGASGVGFCDKIATKSGTYTNSLDNDKTLGNQIVLREAWSNASASGLLIIHPKKRSISICKGSVSEWDSLPLQGMYDIKSSLPLKTMEVTGSTITAISEANELFVLESNSYITDPTDFVTAIAFNIRQFFDDQKFGFPFSCVSTQTWNYPTSRIGWIGSEGPRSFDFVKVDLLIADQMRMAWNNLNSQTLNRACVAVDPNAPYSPLIRIAGLSTSGATARTQQLAYSNERQTWLDFGGQATIDAMTTITMVDGTQRVLFGNSGRLYLYGQPVRDGQNLPPRDLYLFPYIGGTQYGDLDDTTYNSEDAIVDDSATFAGFGDGYCYQGSGVRVVKIDDQGAEEWATITSRYSNTVLYVTPDSTWTKATGRSYRYIIGPCSFSIKLPTLIPGEGMGYVEIDKFRLDIRDFSSFNWKTTTTITASYDTANLDDGGVVATIDLSRSDLTPLWQEHTVSTAMDYALGMEVAGIHAPDGRLLIRGIDVTVRYHD